MRSTKDKTLCTTPGCIRPRAYPKAGKCYDCLAEARYLRYYRKSQENGNIRNEADVMGHPALSPNGIAHCRRWTLKGRCEWTGIRRDLAKHIKEEHTV